jgi:hypothetical protein
MDFDAPQLQVKWGEKHWSCRRPKHSCLVFVVSCVWCSMRLISAWKLLSLFSILVSPFRPAFYSLRSKIRQSWPLLFVKVYVQWEVKNINSRPLFENKRTAQCTLARLWLRFDFFIIMVSFSLPGEMRRDWMVSSKTSCMSPSLIRRSSLFVFVSCVTQPCL